MNQKSIFLFVDKTKCKAIILSAVRGNTVFFLLFVISLSDETLLKTPYIQYRDGETLTHTHTHTQLQGPQS